MLRKKKKRENNSINKPETHHILSLSLPFSHQVLVQDVPRIQPIPFRFVAKYYPEDVGEELIQPITQHLFYLQVKQVCEGGDNGVILLYGCVAVSFFLSSTTPRTWARSAFSPLRIISSTCKSSRIVRVMLM